MRAGLRDDAYQSRQKDHESGIVADPPVDVDMLKTDSKNEKDAECPCEYGREMLLYNMVPEMFLYKMIGSKEQDKKYDYTQAGKEDVHPVFAEEVYVERSFAWSGSRG